MSLFDLEEDSLLSEIEKRKAKKLLIQLPDGLKPLAVAFSHKIEEKTGVVAFISADPCYGGCDLAIDEAKFLGVDLILHVGHTGFVNSDVPTLYLEAKAFIDTTDITERSKELLQKASRVGIATTIQHVDTLEAIGRVLEASGIKTVIPPKSTRTKYGGQIIGCDYESLKTILNQIDAYLIVGSVFHAIGAALTVNKPVVCADPYSNRVLTMEDLKKKILKQRFAFIDRATRAKEFGIIIGVKPGQFNLALAANLRRKLRERGRNVSLLCLREITPEHLADFTDIEVFISTACPRVAIDDPERFGKPILTARETLVVTGETSWEKLMKEGLL